MAYATVTLTGTYQTPDGTPHKGHVEIIPSERVIKDTTGDVILTGRVKVELDAQGAFTVVLPATDDPTLNPTGFGYTIAAKLHSSHPPAVSFSLPAALGATTVEDLTPVDPSTFAPTTTYAESSEVAALDSRVTTLESDVAGKANSADLATVATTGNYTDLGGLPVIPSTAADVGALPDTTVIPTTPADIGAEPAGLSQTTQNTLAANTTNEVRAQVGRRGAATFMTLGDSITDFMDGTHSPTLGWPSDPHTDKSWALWGLLHSNSRLINKGSVGQSSYTTAQIRDNLLPTVIAAQPDYCVVLAGQNDPDAPTVAANLPAIVDALLDAGIRPILGIIPATQITIAKREIIRQIAEDRRLPVADFYTATADPSTAVYISGYSDDGTHPNAVGAKAMGQALADVFNGLQVYSQTEKWLAVSDGNHTAVGHRYMVLRPLFTTDGGQTSPGPIPTGWQVGGNAGTLALTTDPACRGRKWSITRSGIQDAAYYFVTSNVDPGDRIRYAFRVGASVEAVGGWWAVDLVRSSDGAILFSTGQQTRNVDFGKVLAGECVVPSTWSAGTACRVRVQVGGAANAVGHFAQLTVKNLNDLGAA